MTIDEQKGLVENDERPVVSVEDALSDSFKSGKGVVLINPDWSDELIASNIRFALKVSEGKPFKVLVSS